MIYEWIVSGDFNFKLELFWLLTSIAIVSTVLYGLNYYITIMNYYNNFIQF